jgi:hypothetical protein
MDPSEAVGERDLVDQVDLVSLFASGGPRVI